MDRFALITGTTSGIGQATALELLERGWNVLGVARRAPTISRPAYDHLQVDLADTAALTGILGERLTTLLSQSGLQRAALVNNAATPGLLGPIANFEHDQLSDVFSVNVAAPIWLMSAFARQTPPSAVLRIVNVSTRAAVLGIAGLGAYGASKAALRMAGMVMAAELDAAGDRRTSILSYEPGTVDTPMQANARSMKRDVLPSVELFTGFAATGKLIPPAAPAREIADFLDSDSRTRFLERRYGA
ncbi:MAG TPA: SDR family NAD(P)-dependent oxidoreductase [Gemmatimonadaceae bacterium]|nr:SDR family NAD(P)-dependent oxidoreductase [Gemmatimonadaceae bacterium]